VSLNKCRKDSLRSEKKPRPIPGLFPNLQPRHFRKKLLAWYDAHARALPWRESQDPYRVWISEIMLQQTRVAAVIEHYHKFVRRFPTVQKLAAAREASVLAVWSGLGYYRRARMMHAAAKVIVREHGGEFLSSAERLRELPGIGRYTAAAIASIAFGEAVAVVDGNVERVLQRVCGKRLAGEQLWALANSVLDGERPGDFNQAMMELGAVVCMPRAPMCLTCPVVKFCATRGELAATNKPAAQKKREIHYALDVRENGRGREVFVVQRARDASLMAGMWELPEIAADLRQTTEKQFPTTRSASRRNNKGDAACSGWWLTLRHAITVTDYTVRVWRGRSSLNELNGQWVRLDRVGRLALTGLTRKILARLSAEAPLLHLGHDNLGPSKMETGQS
jgi:A/G-specific adenine glycosylase